MPIVLAVVEAMSKTPGMAGEGNAEAPPPKAVKSSKPRSEQDECKFWEDDDAGGEGLALEEGEDLPDVLFILVWI